MKVLLLALALGACDRDAPIKPAVAPPPPPAPPAQPFACGELTCAGQELCIETIRAGGVAPPPGTTRPPGRRYRCAPAPDPDCITRDAHHQECDEKIPAARPH